VNGVEPGLSGKKKLSATRDNVVQGWLATETALREQGLNKEANQVLDEAAIAAEKISNRLNSNCTQCRVR